MTLREKNRLYKRIERAIKNGSLIRLPCERCGKIETHAHHDDYSKPDEIQWLCSLHHRERHKELGWGSAWSNAATRTRWKERNEQIVARAKLGTPLSDLAADFDISKERVRSILSDGGFFVSPSPPHRPQMDVGIAVARYAAGASLIEAASSVCSPSTLHKRLKQLNIETRPRGRPRLDHRPDIFA